MKKLIIFILFSILSVVSFSDSFVTTGILLIPEFKLRNNTIKYTNTKYLYNIFGIKTDIKDGLDLQFYSYSKRNDLLLKDNVNHDLMSKLLLNFNNKGIKFNLIYYLPNLFSQKIGEYNVDDEKARLKKVDLYFGINKTEDESIFKLDAKYISEHLVYLTSDSKLSVNLLNKYLINETTIFGLENKTNSLFNKKYDPNDNDLVDTLDTKGVEYINIYKNNFLLQTVFEPYSDIYYLEEKEPEFSDLDRYILNIGLNSRVYNIGDKIKKERVQAFYEPFIGFNYTQDTGFSFKLKYSLLNKLIFENLKDKTQNTLKRVSYVLETGISGYIDERLGDKSKFNDTFTLKYIPQIDLLNVDKKLLKQSFFISNLFNLNYKLNNSMDYIANVDLEALLSIQNKKRNLNDYIKLHNVDFKADLLFNFNYKVNKYNTLKFEASDLFLLNNLKKQKIENLLKLKLTAINDLVKLENHNLKFSLSFGIENSLLYNYQFRDLNYQDFTDNGKYKLEKIDTQLKLSSLLSYSYKINSKVKFILDNKLDFKLNLLKVSKDNLYKILVLENDKENIVENREYFGSLIDHSISMGVTYEPIEKLDLEFKTGLGYKIGKNVSNKEEDKDNINYNKYGPVDKEFKFRSLDYLLSFNLKYSW